MHVVEWGRMHGEDAREEGYAREKVRMRKLHGTNPKYSFCMHLFWQRGWALIRVFVTLIIGASILVSNFGYDWYTDSVCTRTQYKPYVNPPNSPQEIQAEVGLHIGLRGINVTLFERDCGKNILKDHRNTVFTRVTM